MEDSSTYQAIIAKGEARGRVEGEARGRVEGEARGRVEGASTEARNLLLRLGRKRFGEPGGDTLQILQNTTELEMLERLMERLLEVESWAELLA